MRTLQAPPSRASPLAGAPPAHDHDGARRLVARVAARSLACAWAGTLFGLLMGLGRVPLLEATLWSLLSGTVLWRTLTPAFRQVLEYWLGATSIELGMAEPGRMRDAIGPALARRGYVLSRHRLQADVFRPRRLPGLQPPLRIAWSGPGAVVEGPRWLVRLAARLAVG